MAPELVLYRMDGSCAMIPHALLREVGADFSEVRLQGPLSKEKEEGVMPTEEYRSKVTAAGLVPALSVDGQVIIENAAIITYVAGFAPDRKLLGRDALENARVHSWMAWLSGTLHGYGYGGLWRPMRFVDDEAVYDNVRAKGRETIKKCYDKIEEGVSDTWALGDHQTVVDVQLHTFYRWGRRIGIDMAKEYPRYTKVMERVEQLPGLRKAMEVEKQPLIFSAA